MLQEFIIDTWKRISALNPSTSTTSNDGSDPPQTDDEYDDIITEMFGGSLQSDVAEKSSEFLQQLKTIDVEPRRQHNFDVWQFWMQRRHTHPELYAVAMVVLTTPSNQVSVERAFSALSLILSDHRIALGEDILADILIVKLNHEVYETILPNLF